VQLGVAASWTEPVSWRTSPRALRASWTVPAGRTPVEPGHRAHRIQDLGLAALDPGRYFTGLRLGDRLAGRHRQVHRPRCPGNPETPAEKPSARRTFLREATNPATRTFPMSQLGPLTGGIICSMIWTEFSSGSQGQYPRGSNRMGRVHGKVAWPLRLGSAGIGLPASAATVGILLNAQGNRGFRW
jgi:hypothetical protein